MANTKEVKIPDIGDFKDVAIIEVLVQPGYSVSVDTPLIVLETDKATIEVPSTEAGVVQAIAVKVGSRVNQGDVIATVSVDADEGATTAPTPASAPKPAESSESAVEGASPSEETPLSEPAGSQSAAQVETPPAHPESVTGSRAVPPPASPSIRKLARQLGVDLWAVTATGPRGRLLREDVEQYVRDRLSRPSSAASDAPQNGALVGILPWPKVDFAKFGAIERQPLVRLRRISGANLARNWVMIPHVTNFDEADITELEAFRQKVNGEQKGDEPKLTMLAFLIKACVEVLRRYPEYNASMDGDELVLKRYFHIGFAADTPNGLMVPVVRDADQKGLRDIARETAELAKLARAGKLKPEQMQGGCFTVSSLGGIGGSGFTPIINAPEVAILGVTKAEIKPKWDGTQFQPRLMVPLNLSWDHRVVDGASAARFLVTLGGLLSDFRRMCL